MIGSHSISLVYDLMDACNLCIWLCWSPVVYFLYTVGDSLLSSWIKFPLLIKIYIYIYIPQSCNPNKKNKKNSGKDLRLPNSLPREGLVCSFSPNLVKRTNLKTSSLSRHLANLIFSNSPQRDSINYHP